MIQHSGSLLTLHKVAPACMWTAIEQVSPETELDTLMTAGTASPQPSLLQQDWADLGREQSRKGSSSKGWQGWEQTLPLALGEGDKVEHGSDDRNHPSPDSGDPGIGWDIKVGL